MLLSQGDPVKLLELLGLAGVRPRGRFPRPVRWPEEGVHRG